ncbi:hypothetical protein CLOHYLEM_05890 [[Clostridium] hylemonae DSM 15053]|uniref:Uncharacterized protein n=1 Tax=[Clostridium] hylemonae DSM 15053 TaxID=553973 RepID=C0C171_9FIRM|nr:hypothetical protein CLOHYLEM_07786 [[Clostridium] hylemonae DSM 15053]EEG73885.1 hypothetical protein CLOHYLEM_05890 [[Clostridium] hylemonae DSM 15053]
MSCHPLPSQAFPKKAQRAKKKPYANASASHKVSLFSRPFGVTCSLFLLLHGLPPNRRQDYITQYN